MEEGHCEKSHKIAIILIWQMRTVFAAFSDI